MSLQAWATDFCLGGVSGAVSKTFTAPIERVKLLIQTQDANPLIRSGEVPRYKGIVDCFSRINSEQGFGAFWRGNFTNCIRYFPTQAFNLSFKDAIKKMFPKYSPKTEFGMFFAVNMASGGMAAAGSLCIVYPLDYARTRLASDVGGGKKTFNGLLDCLKKTAAGPQGPAGLYAGFGVSLAGIIPYRGFQLGAFDTLVGLNPYKNDSGILGLVSTFASAQTASLRVLPSAIPSTPCVVVCRCKPSCRKRSMSTTAPSTASRKLLQKKASRRVCTKASLPTLSGVLELLLCLSCTTAARSTWAFEWQSL